MQAGLGKRIVKGLVRPEAVVQDAKLLARRGQGMLATQ
jgi:hypothetical protein